jgi:predicted transcriptional regulator
MEGGPEPQVVEARFIEAAVRLWRDYLWLHARAAVRQIGLTDHHAEARRILLWLKASNRQDVSREELRAEALSRRLDADQVQTIIDELMRAGWLRERTAKTEGPGRPARRWEVNPQHFSIH